MTTDTKIQSQLEKTEGLGRKLNVTVPASAVAQAFDKIFKILQKQANIKGFRQGKAPLATIKSMYGDRVKQDVVQELVQKHYGQALVEQKVEPISYPEFEFDQPSENQDFSFTANFDIKPEIKLKNYKNLEIETEKAEFDQTKVTQVLENIRSSKATLVDVLEVRPAEMGDVAIIDFDGYVDGAPLEGGQDQGHNLELGANQFIDGFEEGIIGMNVGDNKTLNLKFPSPYHSKDLENKPVEFKVKLTGLKKKSLPELTDDMVKEMMGNAPGDDSTKTVEGLKESIRKDIQESEQRRIENDTKNRILKKLVKENPVEVPASMLIEQKRALAEDMKSKMMDQGLTEDQFAEYVDKWDGDFTQSAKDMIQSGFLVDAIAREENLLATDDDVEQKFLEYAKQTGIELDRIKEFYGNPERESRMTYMITEEKVVAHLLKTAKITEVPASKLKESAN